MFHQITPTDAVSVEQLQLPPDPLTVKFTGVRFLGRGVAINGACPPLTEFREAMRRELTHGDGAGLPAVEPACDGTK